MIRQTTLIVRYFLVSGVVRNPRVYCCLPLAVVVVAVLVIYVCTEWSLSKTLIL